MSVVFRPSVKQVDSTTPEALAAENAHLKQQVTGLQLALCEVFERVETLASEKEDNNG